MGSPRKLFRWKINVRSNGFIATVTYYKSLQR